MSSRHPALVALLGNPVEHSLSPSMQNRWFRALDLPYIYLAFSVAPEDFLEALEGLLALGARGCNITVPYKKDAWKVADELSPQAELSGAVNTLIFQEGLLQGYNTDVLALEQCLDVSGLSSEGRCLLLGSGGAAAGALAALAFRGWKDVVLCCRNPEKGEALLERYAHTGIRGEVLPWNALQENLGAWDLWINATSLGLPSSPWPQGTVESILEKNPPDYLVDFVYSPGKETPPVRWARERGCPRVTGEELLELQGREAFRLFTGREVPGEDTREARL